MFAVVGKPHPVADVQMRASIERLGYGKREDTSENLQWSSFSDRPFVCTDCVEESDTVR